MALSKLAQIRSDGIEYIDHRPSLYYSKYLYRARYYCKGITMLWFRKTEAEIDKQVGSNKRWKDANVPAIKAFLNWKDANNDNYDKKLLTIRMEGNVASVFSNDLTMLKTLENLGVVVDFTIVDESIPQGTKYFARDPKHKYRLHLKSKRVADDFPDKLKAFIDRYKDTDTVIIPSRGLKDWVNPSDRRSMWSWRARYCSSHYYIDYNDESVTTLFMLCFDGMVHRCYKLEKRPDNQ